MLKEIAAKYGLANGPWMDIYGNIQLFVTGAPCLSCVRMLMGSKDAILLFATIGSKFCQTSEVGAMWQFHLLMPNVVGSESGITSGFFAIARQRWIFIFMMIRSTNQ